MAWFRLDDALQGGSKWRSLLRRPAPGTNGLEAFGLWTAAGLHCARDLTDGFIDPEWLEDTLDDAKISAKKRAALIESLVERGWFDRDEHGLRVHDYLDFNPSRADVEAQRAAAAEKKRRQRAGSNPMSPGDTSGTPGPVPGPVPELPSHVRGDAGVPRPVPSRPDLPDQSFDLESGGTRPTQPTGPVDNSGVEQPNLSVVDGRGGVA